MRWMIAPIALGLLLVMPASADDDAPDAPEAPRNDAPLFLQRGGASAEEGQTVVALVDQQTGFEYPVQALDDQTFVYLAPLRQRFEGDRYHPRYGPDQPHARWSAAQVRVLEDRIAVRIRGRLVTEYHFGESEPRPYFHPVLAPGGRQLTRGWPMEEREHEEKDHPHHRGLWFTFGAVNGHDFWSEHDGAGTIRHRELVETRDGPLFGSFTTRNDWLAPDGARVCSDLRTFRAYDVPDALVLDYEITLLASDGPVTFGDTKEGMMAIRLAPTLRLKGEIGAGHILNAAGDTDDDTWGKRAKWCDYFGPVDGETVGVAIFDHPKNLRHPTWWHVRGYGLFAANPFGQSYFEGSPRGTGDHLLPAGESLTFRYRIYVHRGTPEQVGVEERFRRFASW